MAFELPPLPSFQTNISQMPPALDQYGKMLQLKSLLGQQQMIPLQVQQQQEAVKQSQIQTQQEQLQMQSTQAMVKAWSNPDFLKNFTGTDKADASGLGFDPDGMTKSLISEGVLPKDALAMTQSFIERSQKIAETQKALAQTGEANAAQRDKGMHILAGKIGGILDLPAAKATDALAALKQDLVRNPQAYAGVPQEDLSHVYGADLEHLPAMATLLGLDARIADFHKAKAEAAKAAQGVIPEGGGLSADAQEKIQADVAARKAEQPLEIAKAVAQGQAVALMQQKIAEGSGAALAGVPAHLVAPATAAANKAGTDYAQAQSVSERLKEMMDAAKNGNVVSYQLIPQEGALQVTTSQGVHRINMAEIQNYGGGSLWQRLEGHLGKQITGESIPASVLKDMEEMQKIQAEGSQTKYENDLKIVNQTYGSKFKPVELEPIKSSTASPAHVPGGKAQGLQEGQTGTGSDGKKYVVKGGVWQPLQ